MKEKTEVKQSSIDTYLRPRKNRLIDDIEPIEFSLRKQFTNFLDNQIENGKKQNKSKQIEICDLKIEILEQTKRIKQL